MIEPSAKCPRTAAILIIGNEVLSGKIQDANSPYLLKELYALGVKVQRVLTIPDELEIIQREVREASASHDFVFTSGGIGPTHDDVTIPAVAAAFSVPLVTSDALVQLARHRYEEQITEATMRMTRIPAGCQLIFAPSLHYPVALMHNVYIFPGVPEFLRAKFNAIKERFRDLPYHLVRIFTRQGESVLAASLEATLERFPGLDIGSYPRFDTDEYRVMLTLESKDQCLLRGARDFLLSQLATQELVRVTEA